MGSFFIPGVFPPGSVVQTLSGNAGVNPVSPDGLNNINVFGDTVTTNVTGDGVNTLTVSVTDNFASTYTTDDANFAVPVAYNLNVFGVDGIATTSAGDTVTIGTDGTLPDTFNGDTGSATPVLGILAIVGGLNNVTSAAGNTVTISETQARLLNNYSVANASPYVVQADDYYITVDTSTIPITIQLPDAPTQYQVFIIKDSPGNASVNNISVTTVSGVLLIDAGTTFTMNTDYQAIQVVYSGFGYEVF